MNLALIGYGKMGREIERVAKEKGLKIAKIFDIQDNPQSMGLTRDTLKGVDVCIDFSSPVAVFDNIGAVAEAGKNMVVGTTGWYDRLDEVRKLVKKANIGFLYASNFSLGVNIFMQLATHAAHLLEKYPQYDAAVTEMHHRGKADSPDRADHAHGRAAGDLAPGAAAAHGHVQQRLRRRRADGHLHVLRLGRPVVVDAEPDLASEGSRDAQGCFFIEPPILGSTQPARLIRAIAPGLGTGRHRAALTTGRHAGGEFCVGCRPGGVGGLLRQPVVLRIAERMPRCGGVRVGSARRGSTRRVRAPVA